ncbi:MAG: DUF4224 domain-containing protein [Rhodoferax sp.]|nr:DUF4224 domain-containing protein [Rhodoferax sp.]
MIDLSDLEIDSICAGYTQNAAKVRFLKRMGLQVRRKPNGKPLVNRAHYDMVAVGERPKTSNEPSWTVQA